MTTIEVSNNWPLMVVPLFGDKASQRESIPTTVHAQHPKNPTIMDRGMEPESTIFLEKGMFVDIYV